ncbi:hypothetical protein SAMD00019534_024580 [Acytostelium subglobosum LB1]|uniref:hypothetical protein n=1 Tax=Acytostelium subglobosum LB1 TaxID=1410327 RepID=UPI000644F37E|nr:hypothetical protein SAMD00019534_024580 [Acytostelium subglobosum LB1]GAM19283.1 hypothetical protein SAMD00019534_024580 [Acytostelium subglobosum LB1]|eukprot:XP_012757210.1 hypothetical protein SAMD00019534_024580 [Acytostelium subglobosum LB1]
MDKGMDVLLQWFEVIARSSDKINAFKSIVGLCPDLAEEKRNRLTNSTSSIADLIERTTAAAAAAASSSSSSSSDEKKRSMMTMVEDELDMRNKRMRVSRLLCNEELPTITCTNTSSSSTTSTSSTSTSTNTNTNMEAKSDDDQSEGVGADYEEENSYQDSFDSQSPEDHAATEDYPGSDDATAMSKMNSAHLLSSSPKSAVAAAVGGLSPSPKQLMIIREKMIEYVQKNPSASRPSCISVCQQPSSKVVWKNRRLDTPFKVRLDVKTASQMANQPLSVSNVVALGVVTDHKGKLQIDSVENFTEAFNAQGLAVFQGLKMTKGTWGKEWSLTFIAVARPANSYSNATILSVSQPFPLVVKTRKNPQIRHNHGASLGASGLSQNGTVNSSENSSSSPEGSPTIAPRRGRAPASAPLMSLQSRGGAFPFSGEANTQIRFPQDDMASLLWAAEIKQREHGSDGDTPDVKSKPLVPSSSSSSSATLLLNATAQTAVSTR